MSHNVTVKQRMAIHMLARGMTGVEIAGKLGIRRETLSRWKRQENFRLELQNINKELAGDFRAQLWFLSYQALRVIQTEFNSEWHSTKRFQAALSWLKVIGMDRMLGPMMALPEAEKAVINHQLIVLPPAALTAAEAASP